MLIVSESASLSTQIHEEVSVDLVEVYVAAVDKKGNPVTDLQAKDFQLKENGKEQKISHFTQVLGEESQTPLTLIFLLDTSGSMTLGTDKLRRIDLAKSFAEEMLHELKPSDRIQLAAFDVQFRPLTPFTSDKEIVAKYLEKVEIPENRGTLMLGAVNLAAAQLEHHRGKRLIVLCSDGERDWRDAPTTEELLGRLKKSDITLISLPFGNDLVPV